MCIVVLPAYMCCEGVGSPGDGVTKRCELPWECWVVNSGSLKGLLVFLMAEPALQPPSLEEFTSNVWVFFLVSFKVFIHSL